MTILGSVLAPPIMETYTPITTIKQADNENKVQCYFTMPQFNDANQIVQVHVRVVNLETNLPPAGLDNDGIFICDMPDAIADTNRYLLTFTLGKDILQINTNYKIQLRFSKNKFTETADSVRKMRYLASNTSNFSEWSTYSILQCIPSFSIVLNELDEETSEENPLILGLHNLTLSGRFEFDGDVTGGLVSTSLFKNVYFDIYDSDSGELLETSKMLKLNTQEMSFRYQIRTELKNGGRYKVVGHYDLGTFNSIDKEYYLYTLYGKDFQEDFFNFDVKVIERYEEGCMEIQVFGDTQFFGHLQIKRASSKDNFKMWDVVQISNFIDNDSFEFSWKDYTIESGVWYKYKVQRLNDLQIPGLEKFPIQGYDGPKVVYLEDIFLTTQDKQLRVTFNPKITNFKKTIQDAKTETLGSRYPIFRRHGKVNYRQFSISGLISFRMDDFQHFLSKEELYNELSLKERQYEYEGFYSYLQTNIGALDRLNLVNNFPQEEFNSTIERHYGLDKQSEEYIAERVFREAVIEFLSDGKPKLFRSSTEGNILVRLADISLTPEDKLGRMLYTFTATATEFDECSLENFDYYNIQKLGEFIPGLSLDIKKLGQVVIGPHGDASNIDNLLLFDGNSSSDKGVIYKKEVLKKEENKVFKYTPRYLTWIRFQMQGPPHLIKKTSDGEYIVIQPSVDKQPSTSANEVILIGYLVKINNVTIFIDKNGWYEWRDDEKTIVTSVQMVTNNTAIVDYEIWLQKKEDLSNIPIVSKYKRVVGQLQGPILCNNWINYMLQLKYHKRIENEGETIKFQTLNTINRLSIEAPQGTIFYVRDSNYDSSYSKMIVGQTGHLHLYNENSFIKQAYFGGIGYALVNSYEDTLKESEYPWQPIYKCFDTGIEIYNEKDFLNEQSKGFKNNGIYHFLLDGEIITDLLPVVTPLNGVLEDNTSYYTLPVKNDQVEEYFTDEQDNKILTLLADSWDQKINDWIYIDGVWYQINERYEVLFPVSCLVDYECDVAEGVYLNNE